MSRKILLAAVTTPPREVEVTSSQVTSLKRPDYKATSEQARLTKSLDVATPQKGLSAAPEASPKKSVSMIASAQPRVRGLFTSPPSSPTKPQASGDRSTPATPTGPPPSSASGTPATPTARKVVTKPLCLGQSMVYSVYLKNKRFRVRPRDDDSDDPALRV